MSTTSIGATRVGVYTHPVPGAREVRACERCGRRRQVRYGSTPTLCKDCRLVDPTFGQTNQERSAS